MYKEVQHMIDGRQFFGMVSTVSSSVAGYLDIVEPIIGISFTIIVGSLTAWYTWERASELRDKRKKRKDKGE